MYSVRILPHQQDTAGMFIAVIHRTRALEDVLKEEREAWAKGECSVVFLTINLSVDLLTF